MVSSALGHRILRAPVSLQRERVRTALVDRVLGLDGLDLALICLFLLGLYTNFTIQISTKVPFPSAPSGIAGLILLWRRRDSITSKALGWFILVVLLYAASMVS